MISAGIIALSFSSRVVKFKCRKSCRFFKRISATCVAAVVCVSSGVGEFVFAVYAAHTVIVMMADQ